jgi:uncharacterized protein YbjQ (UPF0145 family)
MIVSGFSGNEVYCLALKGWVPGSIVVGNSVQSLGVVGGIASGLRTIAGGEIENLTRLITEGRHAAIDRLEEEAENHGADGVTGVTSELRKLSGLNEFIAIGSSVLRRERGPEREGVRGAPGVTVEPGPGGRTAEAGSRGKTWTGPFFTTACSGQDLYCQLDAGYEPRHFVIGNVAYALGVSRGLFGFLRGFAGGEVKEFSDMYNHTRHLALQRIEKEALERGANAVVDIQTQILPIGTGAREMLMVGTASFHPAFGKPQRPVTSELTGEELWNLTSMGYAPLRLVLGTSVYSLGFAQGIGAFFSGLSRGEVGSLTQLIYQARANCLAHIEKEAREIGADSVIGIKVYIYELGGGLVEVMAIGTAIKKREGLSTQTPQLIPQAIIRDRDTFFDVTQGMGAMKLERSGH